MRKALLLIITIVVLSTSALAVENNKIDNIQGKQVLQTEQNLFCPMPTCDDQVGKTFEFEEARSGCCSHHSGVCGCSNGRAQCCDGSLSPSCGC